MNKNKRSILTALVIGDGYLSKPDPWDSVSLEIEHGESQKEYVEYKINLLHKLIGGNKPKLHSRTRERKGTILVSYRFRKGYKYFRVLRKWMYKNDKKVLTEKILNFLSDHGVAIWVMDDGSLSLSKREDGTIKSCQFKLSLCTTMEQAVLVQKFFKDRYSAELKVRVHMYSKENIPLYSLFGGTKEYLKIAERIDKYVIPLMKYKTAIYNSKSVRQPNMVEDIC